MTKRRYSTTTALLLTVFFCGGLFVAPWAVIMIVVIYVVAEGIRMAMKAYSLRFQWVEVVGDALIQKDKGHRIVGRIDLNADFEAEWIVKGYGTGICRVRQGDTIVEFTTKMMNAEGIARDVLKLDWPPIAKTSPLY